MNWRGLPLTSHEVIVQTIAATTTRTALRVRAELDTSGYDTGVKVSDRQMDALPAHPPRLARRLELQPPPRGIRPHQHRPGSVRPAQPRPGLALPSPALTGLGARDRDTLIAALMTLHDQQRAEAGRHTAAATALARPPPHPAAAPSSPSPERLLSCRRPSSSATALPQVAIAALFSVRPETINKRIRHTRQLLHQAGHAIQPDPDRLASPDDLSRLAAAAGISAPPEIKTAC